MRYRAEEKNVMSDEQIIELYWQRDDQAIEETDNKYGKFLFRIAYNVLHDRCDSEECRNDAYLGVWNAIPPTRPKVFPAFITQITRRKAINRYKEKNTEKRIPSELTVSVYDLADFLSDGSSAETEYIAREVGKAISDYVRGLSEKRRFIFVGRFYIGETVESIAQDLGLTSSAVYKELEKLKKGLKTQLERNGYI